MRRNKTHALFEDKLRGRHGRELRNWNQKNSKGFFVSCIFSPSRLSALFWRGRHPCLHYCLSSGQGREEITNEHPVGGSQRYLSRFRQRYAYFKLAAGHRQSSGSDCLWSAQYWYHRWLHLGYLRVRNRWSLASRRWSYSHHGPQVRENIY